MPVLHTLLRLGAPLLAAAALPTVPAPPAAAASAVSAAPAPAAAAVSVPAAAFAEEPGWRAEPVSGSAGSAVRPYFYLAGPPGTVLEDRLALVNTTGQEHTVTLRGADAHNTAGGALAVRPARESTDAGSWISFGAGTTVKLPPRTRAVVPFTVTVPPASPPGDHPAAVVATEAGREVGVRVHLRVSGPALAALTVEDVAVRGRGAGRAISYTLVNRGNVTLAPRLAIRAEGRFGEVAGPAPRAVPVELLPGRRVALTEPWPGAPVLDRVELTLTVTAPGGARATAAVSVWCVPWGIAGRTGAGLLALGGATPAALVLVRIRRTRRARREPADATATAPAPVRTPAPDHELTGASR
ncbi:COG1470 family protein [Streptomyces goshikiensis]|uniref:COG1470 family protein n=1 Tax=Streptomyces goshikiensis TaxID=1942 RepID=UPI0036D0987D